MPLLLLSGCAAPTPPPPGAGLPSTRSLRVVTTVLPVGLFTRAVAGDCARVESLLPAGADLHDPQVSPG
ncbi:MAG: metal ABC transporter solute-binding protein, Zn/Mn family [Vulcanococcus sp.]